MDNIQQIRDNIQRIAGTDKTQSVFITASVVSIDGETCTVEYDGLEMGDVMLGAVVDGNAKNLKITPTVGSMVLLADLSDGQMRELAVVGWSEIDSIEISGGQNGGVVKVKSMIDWMNKVYTDLQTLKNQLATQPVVGSGTALGLIFNLTVPQPVVSDFENPKFKH